MLTIVGHIKRPHGVALPQISWAGKEQLASGTTGDHPASGPSRTSKRGALAPARSIVTATPQIGWQAFGPAPDGTPVMARTMLLVDPHRSYAGVALVRMDLTRLSLHMMPGIIEPAHPSGIEQAIPSLGMVPLSDLALLGLSRLGACIRVVAFQGVLLGVFTVVGLLIANLLGRPVISGGGWTATPRVLTAAPGAGSGAQHGMTAG